jgi:hypothetical protein
MTTPTNQPEAGQRWVVKRPPAIVPGKWHEYPVTVIERVDFDQVANEAIYSVEENDGDRNRVRRSRFVRCLDPANQPPPPSSDSGDWPQPPAIGKDKAPSYMTREALEVEVQRWRDQFDDLAGVLGTHQTGPAKPEPATLEPGPEPSSPLPFQSCKPCDENLRGCGLIFSANGQTMVATVHDEHCDLQRSDEQRQQDRRYIVAACNNYPRAFKERNLAIAARNVAHDERDAAIKQLDAARAASETDLADAKQPLAERDAARARVAELEAQRDRIMRAVGGVVADLDMVDREALARTIDLEHLADEYAALMATPGDPTP